MNKFTIVKFTDKLNEVLDEIVIVISCPTTVHPLGEKPITFERVQVEEALLPI